MARSGGIATEHCNEYGNRTSCCQLMVPPRHNTSTSRLHFNTHFPHPTSCMSVFPHVYTLLTASLVLSLSWRLTCSQDVSSQFTVRSSDTFTRSFVCYQFITCLLGFQLDFDRTWYAVGSCTLLELVWSMPWSGSGIQIVFLCAIFISCLLLSW